MEQLEKRLRALSNARTMMLGERYLIRCGRLYRIRFMADPNDPHWNAIEFDRGIRPFVGTIAAVDPPDFYDFPAEDVLAEFPGFVGARYSDRHRVVYTAIPDRVTEGQIIYAGCYLRQARRLWCDVDAREELEQMRLYDEEE